MLTDLITNTQGHFFLGLLLIFSISFIAATLVPIGSELWVISWLMLHPEWFWSIIITATLGNTLGGMLNYAIGYYSETFFHQKINTQRYLHWLKRWGAKTMLLAWLPGIGDFLCLLAGWARLSLYPCIVYMAIGKFLRYLIIASTTIGFSKLFF